MRRLVRRFIRPPRVGCDFCRQVPDSLPEVGDGGRIGAYALIVADSEIDPFSPAGTVERFGEFSRGLSRRRWGKVAVWMALGMFVVIPAVSYLVVVFVGHH